MDRIATPAIECRDLWFQYNGHYILENIALTVAPGDFVAVIGPNGGGKTTLLKLILGLLKPSRGQVTVMGHLPNDSSHLIGYVPQGASSGPHFPVSVLDVVLMGTLMPGIRRHTPTRRQRILAIEALDMMEASHLAHRRIGDLSGGQRRRVFIARALVAQPQILLLDEPMAGIDPQGQNKLYCLLESINAEAVKTTIMLVSHDLMAISTHVKSVACVNRRLHFHDGAEITPEMLDDMYPGIGKAACPVELVAHGVPHRVLRSHEGSDDV